jgi:hypothetical protein
MKRLLSLTLVLGLVASGAGLANANLLANPDLDKIAVSTMTLATPVSWVAAASKSISGPFNDGMSSEGFANVLQPTGDCTTGCGLFFKPFQGNLGTGDLLSASLSQDHSASPGVNYALTGWAGAGAGYIGLTDPTVKSQFVLQFLNSSSTVVGSSTLNLVPLLGVVNGNPFQYKQFTVSGTAPAGTVTVRSIAQMLNAYGNPAGGDQAFVVDSFGLVAPEPASIVLGLIAAAGVFGLVRRHR